MKKLSIADAVSLTTIAAAGLVCVSLAYEYGFAAGAGISIGDLSLTPQDFVKSAASWAPFLFLGLVGIFALESTTSVIEGGRSEEDIVRGTRNPELWRKIRQSPDYGYLFLGILLLAALLVDADFIRPFAHLTYALVWLSLAGFLVTRESLRRKFPPMLLFGIWAVAGVMFLVYGLGKQKSLTATETNTKDIVELSSGATYSGHVLRRYSEFVLFIRADGGDRMIISSSEIRMIKRANQ